MGSVEGEGVGLVLQVLQLLHGFLLSLGWLEKISTFAKDKTLKYNMMKNEVEQWLKNGADYGAGVELLKKYSTNRLLVRRYEHSSAEYLGATLKALLCRMARVAVVQPRTAAKVQARATVVPQPRAAVTVAPRATVAAQPRAEVAKAALPAVVEEAKSLLHELWVAMSAKQEQLQEVGEGNSEAEVAERKRIMAERDPIIKNYNELYELKEAYFESGEVSGELEKMVKRLKGEETDKTATSLWADMSDLELTKARHAKKMQMTRCENQLNYQSNRREAERKPMPEGPKRKQIESKYKTLQAELRDMDLEIEKRGLRRN